MTVRTRRRRLTLAPKPWRTSSDGEAGSACKGSWSPRTPTAEAPEECASRPAVLLLRRHSAPATFSPTEERIEWADAGSRFWALSTEESSDEEDGEVEEKESLGSEGNGKFFRAAVYAGFSLDELKKAEAQAATGVSLVFNSANVGAGQVKHPRTLARRVVDAVADWRGKHVKGWKGPLPPVRTSPTMSLGDIRVSGSRSGNGKGQKPTLAEFCEGQISPELRTDSPAVEKTKTDLDSNLNVPSGWCRFGLMGLK
ncbi:unnamed protein product [Urochloa humidicola]